MAEALKSVSFKDGEVIVNEGEVWQNPKACSGTECKSLKILVGGRALLHRRNWAGSLYQAGSEYLRLSTTANVFAHKPLFNGIDLAIFFIILNQ